MKHTSRQPNAQGTGDRGTGPLDAIFKLRLRQQEKVALRALAKHARMTASDFGRRRLFGYKVIFNPPLAVLEHLRQACVLAEQLAAKQEHPQDAKLTADLLVVLRAAMSIVGIGWLSLWPEEASAADDR